MAFVNNGCDFDVEVGGLVGGKRHGAIGPEMSVVPLRGIGEGIPFAVIGGPDGGVHERLHFVRGKFQDGGLHHAPFLVDQRTRQTGDDVCHRAFVARIEFRGGIGDG